MISPTRAEGWQLEGDSAEAYERYLGTAFRPFAEDLVRLAAISPGDRVLDVACGTGVVARQAAAAAGRTGSVVGLDINAEMLRVATAVSADIQPPIEWRQGDATRLPFAASAFDVITCEQGLAFFADPPAALAEMRRVLDDGGRVAVSVCRPVECSATYTILADALERHVGREAGTMMRSPFSRWTVGQFRQLFNAAGFADVRVRIEVASLRYPSIAELLRREAASSPLAGPISAVPPDVRQNLVSDLESRLVDRVDDEGIVCGMEIFVATARTNI
jgi:ubiquinone/menaquinone biosynthesis C-methylase UbiE